MPLVVGTAGHIDHGKTWLVRALTGKDTDRLPEEHERGISIDLGYAPLELPGGLHLSLVDVPGHERFVRNMVAGATGVDLFLLVIDAAEGARPQTHEHLAILRLLGVKHGVAARAGDGFVRVSIQCEAEALSVRVSNSGAFDTQAASGSGPGIGLANVRRRLALCYGEATRVEVDVTDGVTTVGFALPVRPARDLSAATRSPGNQGRLLEISAR